MTEPLDVVTLMLRVDRMRNGELECDDPDEEIVPLLDALPKIAAELVALRNVESAARAIRETGYYGKTRAMLDMMLDELDTARGSTEFLDPAVPTTTVDDYLRANGMDPQKIGDEGVAAVLAADACDCECHEDGVTKHLVPCCGPPYDDAGRGVAT